MARSWVEPVRGERAELPLIYQIRLDLKDIHPPIWRRLLLPSDLSLDIVHEIIQVAMGWSNSHLHAFSTGVLEIGDTSMDDYGMLDADETEVVLSDVLTKVGDRLKYEYDFGDGWMHVLKLEKILPNDPDVVYPVCVTGRRACPPEDVGGVWGYQDFLEAIADEGHPDHDGYVDWVGPDFDAEAFDTEKTTLELQALMGDFVDASHSPHPLTATRWAMLSHEIIDRIPIHLNLTGQKTADPEEERWARRIRRSKSAKALLDLLPFDYPALLGEWLDHWQAFSPTIASRAVERLAMPETYPPELRTSAQEHLILGLHRLGPAAIRSLVAVFAMLDDYGKALVCLALGQLDAREASDMIWEFFQQIYTSPDTGWFLGPLWALVDLGDARAADAIAQVLEDGWSLREIAVLAGRAGDVRALLPLLYLMQQSPSEKVGAELVAATALVAHRVGRMAILDVLGDVPAVETGDGLMITPETLADELLTIPIAEAERALDPYFRPAQVEEFLAELLNEDDPYDEFDWLLEVDALDWQIEDEESVEADDDGAPAPPPKPALPLRRRPSASHTGPTPGRNDPCWCGSGKRYKDCHWREDQHKDIPRAA